MKNPPPSNMRMFCDREKRKHHSKGGIHICVAEIQQSDKIKQMPKYRAFRNTHPWEIGDFVVEVFV